MTRNLGNLIIYTLDLPIIIIRAWEHLHWESHFLKFPKTCRIVTGWALFSDLTEIIFPSSNTTFTMEADVVLQVAEDEDKDDPFQKCFLHSDGREVRVRGRYGLGKADKIVRERK